MLDNEEVMEVYVRNPKNNGGHIVYEVKGMDKDGPYEGVRRYNDFNAFRQLLVTRYPGLYIPKIPPKKAIVRFGRLRVILLGEQGSKIFGRKEILP